MAKYIYKARDIGIEIQLGVSILVRDVGATELKSSKDRYLSGNGDLRRDLDQVTAGDTLIVTGHGLEGCFSTTRPGGVDGSERTIWRSGWEVANMLRRAGLKPQGVHLHFNACFAGEGLIQSVAKHLNCARVTGPIGVLRLDTNNPIPKVFLIDEKKWDEEIDIAHLGKKKCRLLEPGKGFREANSTSYRDLDHFAF